MTSKLEEAAKAYWTANEGDNPALYSWEHLAPKYREQKINHMRAALQVLREPDEAMAKAGHRQEASREGWSSRVIWQTMIDAILQEGE